MKTIINILILLFVTINGFSKCISNGLDFWPTKQTINKNSIFVIDGYTWSQKIVRGLGTTYKVYLKSEKEEINLKVQEICVGQYNLTQAILKPEKPLSVGKEYELVIENLGVLAEEVSRFNYKTNQHEKIKWTVEAQSENVALDWIEKPKYKDSYYELFGCGPASYANFTYSANENSAYLIKTSVKNKATGTITTYYLKSNDKIISIGHGMCSGEFTFDGGDTFEVEFTLVDATGNLTKWTGDKIEFKRPF